MRTILFLCTGNYYRSRFAELLFNALAPAHNLNWQADSRGLAIEKGVNNVGPISLTAVTALEARGIPLTTVARSPLQVQEHDLQQATMIIALKEAEHRPYLQARYPAWVDKVVYWHVHDGHPTPQYNPLQEIATEMQRLVQELASVAQS
jgi:protein-tyrosine phosphatase